MDNIHNNDVLLRPRFELYFTESEQELLEKFRSKLSTSNCPYRGKIVNNHVIIDIPHERNYYWSPQLQVEIVKNEDDVTVTKVLFGPKPQVWTLFMFLHFAIGIVFLIALIVLYVKRSLQSDCEGVICVLTIVPIIWFTLYVIGRLIRKKGLKQMEELHQFMMKTLMDT